MMRRFLQKLILLTVVLISFKILQTTLWEEPAMKQAPARPQHELTSEASSDKPKESSLSSWMGKDAQDLKARYGEPVRIDQTEYHLAWWVYNQDLTDYKQFAIRGGKIVSVVGAGEKADVAPYQIGKQVGEYHSLIEFKVNYEFQLNGENYKVKPNEADFSTQPLVQVGDHLAVVYIDKISGVISAVRFIDQQTLLDLKLFPFTYTGQLPKEAKITEARRTAIQRGYELQVIDLSNAIRIQKRLEPLSERADISEVSRLHSQDMFDNHYFSHVSPDYKTLGDRMSAGHVKFREAAENIAMGYTDSLAAVEGWLNSPKHREALLNADYEFIGSGIEGKYYTQNFIKK